MYIEDIKEDSSWLMKGDCLERMKEIPDGSVDLILTDPPYEISNSSGGMMGKDGRVFIEQVDKMRKDNFRITRTATRITLKQSLNLKGSTYSINSCRRSSGQISIQRADRIVTGKQIGRAHV